jgi:hypothetical protein
MVELYMVLTWIVSEWANEIGLPPILLKSLEESSGSCGINAREIKINKYCFIIVKTKHSLD